MQEEPTMIIAMQLIGHNYMPSWNNLQNLECKSWILHHMDTLLDENVKMAQLILAIEVWTNPSKARRDWKRSSEESGKEAMEIMGQYILY